MKIKFHLPEMLEALDVVSVVDPSKVTNTTSTGYLFVVREGRCLLYSNDGSCVARASFGLSEFDEEGSFAFPDKNIGAFRCLAEVDDTCEIESVVSEDRFIIRYKTPSGAETERTTFDPDLLVSALDVDLEAAPAAYDFPAPIVREALSLAQPFLAQTKDQVGEQFKGLQVMDHTIVNKEKGIDYSKGDGYLYASDNVRAFFFFCDAFKGKSLEVHALQLPFVTNFLAKCHGKVVYRRGNNYSYAVAENGNVLGWTRHSKLYDRFNYYTLKGDQLVMNVSRSRLLNALQHVRAEIGAQEDKVYFNVDPDRKIIRFELADKKVKLKGIPVPVESKEGHDLRELRIGANLYHFIQLVDKVKGNDVELRCYIDPQKPNRAYDVCLFRTIDEFLLDASGKVTPEPEGSVKCRVTRFMPSKE
jgi:hypothetical protein